MIAENSLEALDFHLSGLLNRLASRPSPELELAALLVSRYRREGNVCLSLTQIAGQKLAKPLASLDHSPKVETWAKSLRASGLVGAPGEWQPLILDQQNRLYLRRYWEYERDLALSIRARIEAPAPKVDLELLQAGLNRLFPAKGNEEDWQRVAASRALTRNFTVVTGGPGTGKTRTVVAILALLIEQSTKPVRLAVVAPSGKAAARLKESIQNAKATLNCADSIKGRLPNDASTIHRLLGSISNSPYFRFNAGRPLVVDAVVVDEASMVDLATMAKLFAAIPLSARVILLGDKDQLASVEAGYVLGDICNSCGGATAVRPEGQLSLPFGGEVNQPMQNSIVELRKNYRFPKESGIYLLVEAINHGHADEAISVLRDKSYQDVAWRELPGPRSLSKAVATAAISGYQSYLETNDPKKALERFASFRILCALRQGPVGVTQLNNLIEQALAQVSLLPAIEPWYPGRPVMVTRNDYNTHLYNGDIGITLASAEVADEKRVYFPAPERGFRRLLPSRLPRHETAYAMTVHKSQGSEFGRVLLILPERDSPVLTRELLYTGLTRAREKIELWASESVLRAAIAKQVKRSSGLRDALWEVS